MLEPQCALSGSVGRQSHEHPGTPDSVDFTAKPGAKDLTRFAVKQGHRPITLISVRSGYPPEILTFARSISASIMSSSASLRLLHPRAR